MTIHSWEHFSSFDIKLKLLIESTFIKYVIGVYLLGEPLVLLLIFISKLININLLRILGEEAIIILFLFPVFLTIPVWIVIIFSKYITWNLKRQKTYFNQTINYNENINEIIHRFNGVRKTFITIRVFLNFLQIFKFLKWGINDEKINDVTQSVYTEISFFIDFIQNLRSDLQLRLEEQQKTLEQAKSEVEQNIHGTSELNQVSELQKARLDQQIEQFKELQRLLVKV